MEEKFRPLKKSELIKLVKLKKEGKIKKIFKVIKKIWLGLLKKQVTYLGSIITIEVPDNQAKMFYDDGRCYIITVKKYCIYGIWPIPFKVKRIIKFNNVDSLGYLIAKYMYTYPLIFMSDLEFMKYPLIFNIIIRKSIKLLSEILTVIYRKQNNLENKDNENEFYEINRKLDKIIFPKLKIFIKNDGIN
ncbi:MAG: hypothetical protein NUV32_09885 [Exilispira sp.]|jgi:hypothetical protein|nr:hypothetical protein [Exilispira sp.]